MRKIVCDKCGKELGAGRPEWRATEIKLPKKTLHLDFCERCQVRVERYLTEADAMDAVAA